MKKHKEDNDFWISGDECLFLMHRIDRPDLKGESHVCVGEAVPRKDGYWEVRIGFRSDRMPDIHQILVGIADSPQVALEVLWEQRSLSFWGQYQ